MPVFTIENKRYTFIHIPKTGGSSIEAWLSSLGPMFFYSGNVVPSFLKCTPQHFTIDYLTLLDPTPSDAMFCIVRDPYQRAESEYHFRTAGQRPAMRPDYSTWMIQQINRYKTQKHHLDNHFLPQSHFVNEKVSRFRFESGFDTIFSEVSQLLNLPQPSSIPHINKSEASELCWSNELLDLFNSTYKNDFELFGYKMRELG